MSAKEMFEDLKINEWLELIKEDKNLKGAYICISQYIYLIQKENQELKKQLENYKKLGFKHLQDKNNKLETQQKEFINYLENMLDNENDIFSVVRVKDVLSKYKKIIGDDK